MLALLTSMAPLLLNIGAQLISWFSQNEADKQANLTAFYSMINDHANDGLKSVSLRDDDAAEKARLEAQQGDKT